MQHNWLFCHTVHKKPAACRSIKAAHALLPQKEIIATGKKTHRRRYRSLTILFDCNSDEALACTCFLTQLWTSGKYCDHGLAQEEMHNLCGLCVFLGSRSVLPPMLHVEKKHRLCRAQQCSVRHSQRPKKHKWNRDNFCQQMLHSSIAELHNGQHFGITERPTADSRQKIYVV